jgi:Caspase domain
MAIFISPDKLLFHFSGHGSQIRDRDGDELKDQLDEIILNVQVLVVSEIDLLLAFNGANPQK